MNYRVIDHNDRDTTVCANTNILRDAAAVLHGRGFVRLCYRIETACAGMRPVSDSVVIVPTIDLPHVARAIALVA